MPSLLDPVKTHYTCKYTITCTWHVELFKHYITTLESPKRAQCLNPDVQPLYGNQSEPNSQRPCTLCNARITSQSWRCLSQSFFCTEWRFISSSWLVVDWMRTIIKKESAGVQQLRADLAEESLRVIERDVCVWQTVCEACAVAQVFRLRGSGGRRFPTACCLPGGYHTQIPSRSGDALTTFFP